MGDADRTCGAELERLPSDELARRLARLAGDERGVVVDFLLHLDAFDRRRAWLVAGYESLWAYCLQALHLREGAAGRRIGAMRALRRLPRLEPALRDGRIALSTVTLLAPLLTEENLDALVARAAYLTKAETERLVVSLQPRAAPRQGIRLVGGSGPASETAPIPGTAPGPGAGAGPSNDVATTAAPPSEDRATPRAPPLVLVAPPAPPRDELRPIDAERWSVRVTLDGRAKADLDLLADLLGHGTGRDLGAVIREAIRCALEKHGKRRGAVAPERARAREPAAPEASHPAAPALDPRTIPVEVRRQVWARDGGRCTYVAPDGRRCGSRRKLEFHHRQPWARGGPPTVANVTLRCKAHNLLAAERDFGAAHMARFTRRDPEAREEVAPYGASVRARVPGVMRPYCLAVACGPAP